MNYHPSVLKSINQYVDLVLDFYLFRHLIHIHLLIFRHSVGEYVTQFSILKT
jgi:hypothetical protein